MGEARSGNLNYRDVDFTFIYQDDELRLVPPKESADLIEHKWLMEAIAPGFFKSGAPLTLEQPTLEGVCHETGMRMVFFAHEGSRIWNRNAVLFIRPTAVMELDGRSDVVERMCFRSPELDRIHPVNRSVVQSFNANELETSGVISVSTKGFDATTTEEQSFVCDGHRVAVSFSIGWRSSLKIGEPPLQVFTNMEFRFDPTSEWSFLVRLHGIAVDFLRFACYRKDVSVSAVELSARRLDGKFLECGRFSMLGESGGKCDENSSEAHSIELDQLEGKEGVIFQQIADEVLYLRHIPKTLEDQRHFDVARCILLTAAFEWEFKRCYPSGVPKDEDQADAEKAVREALQGLIDSTSGKRKKILKSLRKNIGFTSLGTSFQFVSEELSDIVGTFGRHLYSLNNELFDHSAMGDRLAAQRNDFAHGNIDKDFRDAALLDLVYLQYLVYAMQLRSAGVSDRGSMKAINSVMHLNCAI